MTTPEAYRQHIRDDVATIATLLEADPRRLSLPVPACPGWQVQRLVTHLGQVHRMVTCAVTQGRPPAREERGTPPQEPGRLVDWLRSGSDQMLAALDRDPAAAAWAFDPEGGRVGFWQRRQAMENVMHRVDVQQAVGVATPVDPALAADGVAEVLDVMVRLRRMDGQLQLPDVRLVLRAGDTGDEWTLGSGTDCAPVTAGAQQLFLALWGRVDAATLTSDPAALSVLGAGLTP